MNLYIVVEGETEGIVYKKWIKYLNPSLRCVDALDQIQNNDFILFTGHGSPFYFEIIESAIDDVNNHPIVDRLVIAVDSDDMSYEEKLEEIRHYTNNHHCRVPISIVVQHFCFETWALANRTIVTRHPQSQRLRSYISFYNVIENDPELMPPLASESLNRAQFAFKYLKSAINEKYRNLGYSKSNPHVLLNRNYFERVKRRYKETSHIASFRNFLEAFS